MNQLGLSMEAEKKCSKCDMHYCVWMPFSNKSDEKYKKIINMYE